MYSKSGLLAIVFLLAACSDSSSTGATAPAADAAATDSAAPPTDAATAEKPDASDASDASAQAADCTAATATLTQTSDASAPVLDAATSNLQRVASNDAFCAARTAGQLTTFGPFGYQLSVVSTDAEGDGPTTLDDVQAAGVVRLASAPDVMIATRTDPKRFSTGGNAIIIQLCLDKVYAASDLALGVDLADKAGHRSKAICVRQPSGG